MIHNFINVCLISLKKRVNVCISVCLFGRAAQVQSEERVPQLGSGAPVARLRRQTVHQDPIHRAQPCAHPACTQPAGKILPQSRPQPLQSGAHPALTQPTGEIISPAVQTLAVGSMLLVQSPHYTAITLGVVV